MDSVQRSLDACLVADVGGTNARLGWARAGAATEVQGLATYRCVEHASLAAILDDGATRLRSARPDLRVDTAVVAIAGFLDGDRLVNANLPWDVSVRDTARRARLPSLELINDFGAVAHAIPTVRRSALAALTPLHGDPGMQSPALVLGPGTGLGAALCLDDDGADVLLTEAGHAALAANDPLELEVLQRLSRRWPHVDNERVLSGSGLMNLHDSLADIRGVAPRGRQAAQVVEAAGAGDALARETLDVFCGWLGSLVGDLVRSLGARQAYLAGGVTAHIAPFLQQGVFQRRYAERFAGTRVPPPVWRIEHGQLGLEGAAAHWRTQRAAGAGRVDPSPGEQA